MRTDIFCLEEYGMQINGVRCTLHHMGIPTTEKKPGERYSKLFGMYTSDSGCRTLRIQWHRFEPGSSLHPLLQTVPHVAFRVDDLERASAGYNTLLGPYEPIPGFQVVIVEDGGQPIELVQTTLTDEQLWERAETDSVLYGANPETF
jgi:hypothetical protein